MKSKYNAEIKLTMDEMLLDKYLSQYKVCLIRKRALLERRQKIFYEFINPLSGVNYDGMPKGSSAIPLGSAKISMKLADVEDALKAEAEQAAESLQAVVSMINFLDDQMQREVLELRYIDNMSWWKVAQSINSSKSKARRDWKRALNALLDICDVRELLNGFVKG